MNNKLVLFTGPSGVGKATVEKELFDNESLNLSLSVSATTRKKREGEIDGVHYHFISMEKFDEKIKNDEFIEWNEHFSNKYGTLKSEIKRISDLGKIPFLEVETTGAKNIIDNFDKSEIISIFLLPPSMEELEERIRGRGTETEEQVQERLSRVREELKYKDIFQHNVVNDNVIRAAKEIEEIIKGGL